MPNSENFIWAFPEIVSFKKMSQFSPSKMWRLLKDYSLGRGFLREQFYAGSIFFFNSPYF